MRLAYTAYLVREYDEAISWFVDALDWTLLEDSDLGGGKRWVRVGGRDGGELLLARATSPEQTAAVGKEAGGRVAFFVHTRAFDRDYARMLAAGVKFAETPRNEVYGRVVVFADLYGNRWDLIEARINAVSDNGETT
ncbi:MULTISPECIES: VOC family protein [Blastomonas]|uniref:VOC family protein n=1 Tax=Blastomonas TaxID=150203 RepID=UPI0009E8C47D|nr:MULTISPECIES: VOC family protein [Blastomonas]MDM7928444.1 VOC family protein [Blastomonas fulva]MDM7967569.1 VOC family protein [Blastomonas fulva]